jgi:2-hydroxychromene-2-carboxylate isomerase
LNDQPDSAAVEPPVADTESLDIYIDFSCPWSYIGLIRLHDVAMRNGAQFTINPVSLNILLDTENPSILESRFSPNPAKAAWEHEDLQLWCELWGIAINFHEKWPFDAKKTGAAWLAGMPEADPVEFARTLFAAHFAEGRDTTDQEVLIDLAASHGLDRAQYGERLADPALQQRVAVYTHELIKRGGFGTPSMFLGEQLFFGNDRVSLLEWHLGPISDAEFVIPGQHGYAGQ